MWTYTQSHSVSHILGAGTIFGADRVQGSEIERGVSVPLQRARGHLDGIVQVETQAEARPRVSSVPSAINELSDNISEQHRLDQLVNKKQILGASKPLLSDQLPRNAP